MSSVNFEPSGFFINLLFPQKFGDMRQKKIEKLQCLRKSKAAWADLHHRGKVEICENSGKSRTICKIGNKTIISEKLKSLVANKFFRIK